jgi:pimeloyl-ACP methyl ester carboxylesterase
MGGWIAMNHAIYAREHVRRLVLLGPMALSPWRANLGVLVPFAWYAMRPTDAKFECIIFRTLGERERVNREFRPWMLLMGKCKPKTGQPFHISSRKLRLTRPPPS